MSLKKLKHHGACAYIEKNKHRPFNDYERDIIFLPPALQRKKF
jgi:hypothetical protein